MKKKIAVVLSSLFFLAIVGGLAGCKKQEATVPAPAPEEAVEQEAATEGEAATEEAGAEEAAAEGEEKPAE